MTLRLIVVYVSVAPSPAAYRKTRGGACGLWQDERGRQPSLTLIASGYSGTLHRHALIASPERGAAIQTGSMLHKPRRSARWLEGLIRAAIRLEWKGLFKGTGCDNCNLKMY